jgi:hypothetical protein
MMKRYGTGFWVLAALSVPPYILNGVAVAQLWAWFIAPTFNLTLLSIPAAIGLAMIVGYTSYQWDSKNPDNPIDRDDFSQEVVVRLLSQSLARPIVILALGFIVSRFM